MSYASSLGVRLREAFDVRVSPARQSHSPGSGVLSQIMACGLTDLQCHKSDLATLVALEGGVSQDLRAGLWFTGEGGILGAAFGGERQPGA